METQQRNPSMTATSSIETTVLESLPLAKPWQTYSDTSTTVIVFVHGFLSNSDTCWRNENGIDWPSLVSNDERFGDVSIFLASYYTRLDSQDYGVADCSSELFELLSMKQEGGRRAPKDFPNIVLVCHSLGGVVSRYMLESRANRFASHSIGLLLIASPSLGSSYATAFLTVSSLLKNLVAMQLRNKGAILQDLDRRFKRFLDDTGGCKIVGMEAVETHTAGFFLTTLVEPIVKWESAARYFGDAQCIGNTTHSSIVKPDSTSHPTHRLLLNFFLNKFLPVARANLQVAPLLTSRSSTQNNKKEDRAAVSKILFEAYDSSCAPYYLTRSVDERVAEALQVYAVWIYGPSGSGKTSLIKRYLSLNEEKPIELALSQLSGSLTPSNFLAEIIQTCSQLQSGTINSIPVNLNGLAIHLCESMPESSIILYLDEIPISYQNTVEAEAFLKVVASLLEAMKQKSGPGTRIILSSIEKPPLAGHLKLNEQLVAMNMNSWSETDLSSLYLRIINCMDSLAVAENFLPQLISSCVGSPRFLKTYLRNRFLANAEISDEIVLDRTKSQFEGQA